MKSRETQRGKLRQGPRQSLRDSGQKCQEAPSRGIRRDKDLQPLSVSSSAFPKGPVWVLTVLDDDEDPGFREVSF